MLNGTTAFIVTFKTANDAWTIMAADESGPLISSTTAKITVNPNTPTRLRVILPPQNRKPGTTYGKSGAPGEQIAGTPFTISVDACDNWWNTNASTSPEVSITLEDGNATPPANRFLANGTTSFIVTFKTANSSWTITAANADGGLVSSTTAKVLVNPAPATKLLILVPNETHKPGTTTGKESSGLINQTAGVAFTVTVYAVDDDWNINTDYNPLVKVNTTDPFDTEPGENSLVSGAGMFDVTLVRASTAVVCATDWSGGLNSSTSSVITVDYNTATKLLVLAPGMTHVPGKWNSTPYGYQNSPSTQTAGTAFAVTVFACDNWWNRNYAANNTVRISSTSDPNDELYGFDPSPQKGLSGGFAVFTSTLVTNDPSGIGNKWTITVSTTDGSALAAFTTPEIPVKSGAAAKLQCLLAGEDTRPGYTTGKEGPPATQTAGAFFTVTVNTVDNYWNFVDPPTEAKVSIDANDPYYKDWGYDVTDMTLSGGSYKFNMKLVTRGTWSVTATDTGDTGTSFTAHVASGVYVNYASAVKYQVLLPTQTAVPGSLTGKSGEPKEQTAGLSFTVTVNATDPYWNVNPAYSEAGAFAITTSDNFDTNPTGVQLLNGTTNVLITMKTGSQGINSYHSTQTVTASGARQPNISSVVNIKSYTKNKLLLLCPNQTYVPGDVTGLGLSGNPSMQPAGGAFTVTVLACDMFYNQTKATPTVTIETTDLYDIEPDDKQLANGFATFNITMKEEGSQHVSSSDTVLSLDCYTSKAISIGYGPAVKLQVLLPGETPAPGTESGKNSSGLLTQTAGAMFTITVNCVDQFWNINPDVSPYVQGTSSDKYDTEPSSKTLTGGTEPFWFTLKTAATTTINAQHLYLIDDYYDSNTSSVFNVGPAPLDRLLVILPGESYDPGNIPAAGKGGLPSEQTAGITFTVTVLATDGYYNTVSTNCQVGLTAADPYAAYSSTLTLNNGSRYFDVTMITRGSWTITANEIYGALPAYQTPKVDIRAAAGSQLVIVLPGESIIEGYGKTGIPNVHEASETSWDFNIYLRDDNFNIAKDSQPTVTLGATSSSATLPGSVNIDANGSALCWVKLVEVKAENKIYAYATGIATGATGNIIVNNSDPAKLVLEGVPVNTGAGSPFSFTVKAKDIFNNVCKGSYDKDGVWVGNKSYAKGWNGYQGGLVKFTSNDSYPATLPYVPGGYTFVTNDMGQKDFTSSKLYTAGEGFWIKAQDDFYTGISGIKGGITVTAGALFKFVVSPVAGVSVAAGESVTIIGTASDQYGNPKSSAGLVCNLVVSTNTQEGPEPPYFTDGEGTKIYEATTNSYGVIGGTETIIKYYVSTRKDDESRAKIQRPGTSIEGQTGLLKTKGAGPYEYRFGTSPSVLQLGSAEAYCWTSKFEVVRYDKFGNLSETGDSFVRLNTDSNDNPALEIGGTSMPGVFSKFAVDPVGSGQVADFVEPHDEAPDYPGYSIKIPDGDISCEFYYNEKKASWDTITPSSWIISAVAKSSDVITAETGIRVDPCDISYIAFVTPPRELTAGATTNLVGKDIEIHTQDNWNNEKVVTENKVCVLSGSGDIAAGSFYFRRDGEETWSIGNTYITFTTNTYACKFYFASDRVGTPETVVKHSTHNWEGGQTQTIIPASISKIVFTTEEMTDENPEGDSLTAGTTSPIITFQTRDRYGNPSPIPSDYPGGVAFALESQPVDPITYDMSVSSTVWVSSRSITIPMGESMASFFYVNTKSGHHEIKAKVTHTLGWTAASQFCDVWGADIVKIIFTTPERRAIAGVDDYTEYKSSYVMTVELRDKFDNASRAQQNTLLPLSGSSAQKGFSTTGAPPWTTTGVLITSGTSTESFYYKDEIKGQPSITVYESPDMGWADAAQTVTVYPSAAVRFSITHAGGAPVLTDVAVTVEALDQYGPGGMGNVCTGRPPLGNPQALPADWIYYTGIASFTASGTAEVTSPYPPYYNFTASDLGAKIIKVKDSHVTDEPDVPPVKISAVDQQYSSICGTSADMVIRGAVVKPYVDPETKGKPGDPDPDYPGDRIIQMDEYGSAGRIYQGSVNRYIERLDLWTNSATGDWKGLDIDNVGQTKDEDILAIRVWKDGNANGRFDAPPDEDPDNIGGASSDIFLASATFSASKAYLTFPTAKIQTIGVSPQNYFITVAISKYTEPDKTFIIRMKDRTYFKWEDNPDAALSSNNFEIRLPTATIATSPGEITVYPYNLVFSTNTVYQGTNKLGVLRLDMVTDKYTVPWSKITMGLTGSADGGRKEGTDPVVNYPSTDIESVRIYRDKQTDPAAEGYREFSPDTDELISSGVETFGQLEPGICIITLRNPANLSVLRSQVISQSTATYYIAYSFRNSAEVDVTAGVVLSNASAIYAWMEGANRVATFYDYNHDGKKDPDESNVFPCESQTPRVIATEDIMIVSPKSPAISQVTQGDSNRVFEELILKIDPLTPRAVWWSGMGIDKLGDLENWGVDAVKVWYYVSGATDTAGNPVVDTSTNTPTGKPDVRVAMIEGDRVAHSYGAFPAGSSTTFINFEENSWQEISFIPAAQEQKHYLITYDIDPFAVKGKKIGMNFESNDYFKVEGVDTVAVFNPFGINPVEVKEYADTVKFAFADATSLIGDKQLNQGDRDLPVLVVNVETDKSDAYWKELIIDQAGGASDSDIDSISVWYDANNNGEFNSDSDIKIASGTFSQGQVKFIFAGLEEERRIGPKNNPFVPREKRYFINLSISDVATPGLTISLKIEGGTEAGYLVVSSPNKIDPGFIATGYVSPPQTLKASQRIMYIDADSVAPSTVNQGESNIPMEKLALRASGYEIPWRALRLTRSGTGIDADVKTVKLYADDQMPGDPNYGAWGLSDILVSSGTFTDAVCYLDFSTTTKIQTIKDLSLNNGVTQYYFIVFDFANSATPGAYTGVQINDRGAFNVEEPHIVEEFSPAIASVQTQQLATEDTLKVTPTDLGVAEVIQGARNVAFAQLALRSDQHDVVINGMKIHRIGSGVDADIEAIKIYRDLYEKDGGGIPGVLDSWDTRYDTTTYKYPGLINYGSEVFIDGVADISFKVPEKVGTDWAGEEKTYFVAFDIANLATVGKWVGFKILPPGTSSFFVVAPDLVENVDFGVVGATIKEYADVVTVSPWRNSEGYGVIANEVVQGEKDILVEKFSLTTKTPLIGDPESEAGWLGMRVGLGGDVPDEDIERIRIFRDLDGDGLFSSAKDQLIGHSDGFTEAGAESIMFVEVSFTGCGITTAFSVTKTNMGWKENKYVGYTLQVTGGKGAGQKKNIVSNTADTFYIETAWDTMPDQTSVFEINTVQIIGTVAKTYFLIYDLSMNAPPPATLGSKFTSPSFFFISQPNVPKLQDDLPIESRSATIRPVRMDTVINNTAPPSCSQSERAVPMFAMDIYVSSTTVKAVDGKPVLQKIKLSLNYTAGYGAPAPGHFDGDINAVLVYLDSNGDGKLTRVWNEETFNFDVAGDTLISSGNDVFSGGTCLVSLTPSLVISRETPRIFVSFDIAADAAINDSVGVVVGQMTNDWITINPPERLIKDASFVSTLSLIKSEYLPRPPAPVMKNAWVNSSVEVSAEWPTENLVKGGVLQSWYAVGREIGGVQNLPWKIAVSTFIKAKVENPMTEKNYYFSVKAVSVVTEDISEPGACQFFVDVTAPALPEQPTVEKSGDSYFVNWKSVKDRCADADGVMWDVQMGMEGVESSLAVAGLTPDGPDENGVITLTPIGNPFSGYYERKDAAGFVIDRVRVLASGVEYYELQEQVDTSARWRTISSNISADKQGEEIAASLDNYEDGTARNKAGKFYRYRVRAIDRAGNMSGWSPVSASYQAAAAPEGISYVSNYPNPVDARKFGDTTIAYTLSEPSSVDITLYDLLGKKVYSWHFEPNEEVFFPDDSTGDKRSGGGKEGPNKIVWYLKNEVGNKVAKGGYICYIKIKNSKGSFKKMYKIAVIK
ncbi:MAG: hypothetical protein ABIJ15_02645 [bacterium]